MVSKRERKLVGELVSRVQWTGSRYVVAWSIYTYIYLILVWVKWEESWMCDSVPKIPEDISGTVRSPWWPRDSAVHLCRDASCGADAASLWSVTRPACWPTPRCSFSPCLPVSCSLSLPLLLSLGSPHIQRRSPPRSDHCEGELVAIRSSKLTVTNLSLSSLHPSTLQFNSSSMSPERHYYYSSSSSCCWRYTWTVLFIIRFFYTDLLFIANICCWTLFTLYMFLFVYACFQLDGFSSVRIYFSSFSVKYT